MKSAEYVYKTGIVGLYTLNDFLHAIILDFPADQHETIEKELGLGSSDIIAVPFNKLLTQLGRLQSMSLR
jgi:hypothetical protein